MWKVKITETLENSWMVERKHVFGNFIDIIRLQIIDSILSF